MHQNTQFNGDFDAWLKISLDVDVGRDFDAGDGPARAPVERVALVDDPGLLIMIDEKTATGNRIVTQTTTNSAWININRTGSTLMVNIDGLARSFVRTAPITLVPFLDANYDDTGIGADFDDFELTGAGMLSDDFSCDSLLL